jgi:hypothetical protein
MIASLRVSFVLLAGVTMAAAQNDKKLTARELFYTPVVDAKPAATSTKPATPKPAQTTAKPQAKVEKKTIREPEQRAQESTGYLQRVSDELAGPPLALRYSLLKHSSGGEYVEVDPETVFRSGDSIKISIEANDGAHLYIVQQGSSKAWDVLFPNEETGQGDNRVERNRRVTIPSGGRFTFDDQAGAERLFIVLSRRAEPDLEKMIYDLSGRKTAPAVSSPGAVPDSKAKLMMAQSRIDDSVVNRLRGQMISRDLVFEKVNEDKREKAMYYGTGDRSPRARIVVDLNLRHQ